MNISTQCFFILIGKLSDMDFLISFDMNYFDIFIHYWIPPHSSSLFYQQHSCQTDANKFIGDFILFFLIQIMQWPIFDIGFNTLPFCLLSFFNIFIPFQPVGSYKKYIHSHYSWLYFSLFPPLLLCLSSYGLVFSHIFFLLW